MKHIPIILCVVSILSIGCVSLSAQDQPTEQQDGTFKVDQRIKAQLDSMEYHYTITNDGDIKLICQISDERTQVVFINSQTQNYQEMEIREIFSPAALFSANNLTLPLAKKLLEENYNKKLGAYQLISSDENSLLTFTVKADANSDALTLNKIIWLVARTSDDLEKEISATDSY